MSIATCPKCHRQVSLPTTDDHSVLVRCPLCGGQYALRTALDHVPPSLEILGPEAHQAAGDPGLAAPAAIAPFQDMQAAPEPACGEMPSHAAPHGDVSAPGEMQPAADTLAHPEHGAVITPTQPDDDISEHLIDFELESPPDQSEGGMIGHTEAAAHETPAAEPQHGAPAIDDLLPTDPSAAAFGDFHPEHHFAAGSEGGDLPVDFMAEPAPEVGAEPTFDSAGGPIGGEAVGGEAIGNVAFGGPEIAGGHPGEQHPAVEPAAHEMFGGEQFAVEDFAGGDLAGEHPLGEHPAGEHPIGEDFGGEHLSAEHFGAEPIAGEHFGDGAPEFQFAADEAPEHAEADTEAERAAMGGIASIVQASPPAKKRRQAPLAVKLVGALIAVVLGIIGCYIVLGAFLMAGNGEARGLASHLHLKPFYPSFVSSHIPDETTKSLRPDVPPARINPQTSSASTTSPAATPSTSAPPTSATPPSTPTSTTASTTATTPAKPGPSDIAQQPPAKTTGGLETFDPNKSPPADLEKPDISKPNSTPIAPPQLDAPKSPFDEAPKASAKPADNNPAAPTPSAATPAPSATPTPDKLATNVSPSQPNLTSPSPTPAPTTPPAVAPAEKTAEKPVIPSSEKSAENNPFASPATKSPLADRLAEIDVAMNSVKQAADNLKSTATPGADPLTVLRARAPVYRAMSHLATALATIEHLPHDPTFAARIEKLRERTAQFAESMGSPAERDTTALLAGKWIASPSRKENGAVIVGTLSTVDPSGQGFAAHVKLPDGSKEMIFTSATKPNVADGAPVVVLGILDADKNGGSAVEIVPAANQPATNPSVNPSTTSGGSAPTK
jgi:hypothetical protein